LCDFQNTDSINEPLIIVADDFSLNDMLLLDKSKIMAFVAVHGATNPYIALLAKMMNVPALVEVDMDLSTLVSGMEAAVDGFVGEFVQEPDENIKNAIISHIEE
jgi:phosphotransferase system enzyme I (PtsI)